MEGSMMPLEFLGDLKTECEIKLAGVLRVKSGSSSSGEGSDLGGTMGAGFKVDLEADLEEQEDGPPAEFLDVRGEWEGRRIKNSRFFDITQVSTTSAATKSRPLSPKPLSLQTLNTDPLVFSKYIQRPTDHVVVYDSVGVYSSPRCWWMFKVFGHENVSVLDGGLPKWISEGREVVSGSPYSYTSEVGHGVSGEEGSERETKPPAVEPEEEEHALALNEDMMIDYDTLLLYLTDFMYHDQN
ncbi:hypothetical protein HK102_009449, partial [Quaeritorhiza haematococci]